MTKTCCWCKHWDSGGAAVEGQQLCRMPKIGDGADADGLWTEIVFRSPGDNMAHTEIRTGPEFGCVHFEGRL